MVHEGVWSVIIFSQPQGSLTKASDNRSALLWCLDEEQASALLSAAVDNGKSQFIHLSQAVRSGGYGRDLSSIHTAMWQMSSGASSPILTISGLHFPYLYQQDWLYCAAQVRCRVCSSESCSWWHHGQLSWLQGQLSHLPEVLMDGCWYLSLACDSVRETSTVIFMVPKPHCFPRSK